LEQDRSLSLRAQMRVPGQALLDFRIAPNGDMDANNGDMYVGRYRAAHRQRRSIPSSLDRDSSKGAMT